MLNSVGPEASELARNIAPKQHTDSFLPLLLFRGYFIAMKSLLNDSKAVASPYRTLLVTFVLWKTILLLVALSSPGIGYDTSTDLLFGDKYPEHSQNQDSVLLHVLSRLGLRFTRWDAIYFVTSAERGYIYEQEWAFGWGFSKAIQRASRRKGTLAEHNSCD